MIVLVSRDGSVVRTPTDIGLSDRGKPSGKVYPMWFRMLREPIPEHEGDRHDLLVISDLGNLYRISLEQIMPSGKGSKGIKAIKLEPFESVADAAIIGRDEI